MKQKSLIYTLALASSLVFLTACGGGSDKEAEEIVKEDDPKDQEPSEVLETMLLDCNSGVPQAETLTLTNRNDTVDYKVDCSYQVSGDLIIEPDVVVEFASESGLHVRGSVQAKGTEVLPVTLTGTSKAAGA